MPSVIFLAPLSCHVLLRWWLSAPRRLGPSQNGCTLVFHLGREQVAAVCILPWQLRRVHAKEGVCRGGIGSSCGSCRSGWFGPKQLVSVGLGCRCGQSAAAGPGGSRRLSPPPASMLPPRDPRWTRRCQTPGDARGHVLEAGGRQLRLLIELGDPGAPSAAQPVVKVEV